MGKHNRSLVIAGLMAAAVAGTASAGGGDNGMNPFYGDSWAALQGGGVNLSGDASMPGANVAHADTGGHFPWHATDSAQSTESSLAAALHRAQAAASENAARMRATLAARAVPPPAPAVHQVDPFEDKAGS
jgi:hypothetical protein